jgi:ribosomal protein L6P/L9E
MQRVASDGITKHLSLSRVSSGCQSVCRAGASRYFSTSKVTRSYVGSTPITIPSDIIVERAVSPSASTSTAGGKGSTYREDRLIVRGKHGETSIRLYDYMRFLLPGAVTPKLGAEGTGERKVKRRNPPCPEDATSEPFVVSSSGTTTAAAAASPEAPPQITLFVSSPTEKAQRQLWGTTKTLIENAIKGQSEGYTLPIYLIGVGYRAGLEVDKSQSPSASSSSNSTNSSSTPSNEETKTPIVQSMTNESLPRRRLVLRLGYSHVIYVPIPQDIKVTVPSPTIITLWGRDKQRVGQFAANIRALRKPEVYKGKVSLQYRVYGLVRLLIYSDRVCLWVPKRSR